MSDYNPDISTLTELFKRAHQMWLDEYELKEELDKMINGEEED